MSESSGSGGAGPPAPSGAGGGGPTGGGGSGIPDSLQAGSGLDTGDSDSNAGGSSDMAEGEETLSDDIARRWDPDRLLQSVSRRAGKGQRLDESTRSKYEGKFGADLSNVRVYSGEFAENITRAHRAEAVTIGSTGMILMRGMPEHSMESTAGRALLAHELTHVAQAQRGVHRRATFGEATPLATEEHEAEAEANEADEHAGGSGGGGGSGGAASEADKKGEETRLKVIARVLDKIAEDNRVHNMRSGPDSWRP